MNPVNALLLVIFLVSQAGLRESKSGALDFRRAYLESDELRVESGSAVSWEQAARRNFHKFDLSHPDMDEIKQHWSEVSSAAVFDYEAPLRSNTDEHYFAVCSSGLAEFKPEKLHGQVIFPSDGNQKMIGPPQFSGQLVGKPVCPKPPLDPGFVLFSETPRTSTVLPVKLGSPDSGPRIERNIDGKRAIYLYRDREGTNFELGRFPVQYEAFQIASLIRISGDVSYLFVRWAPDTGCVEACCEHRYSLYRTGPDAIQVLSNDYGCDV
jgi:hypothetical protein